MNPTYFGDSYDLVKRFFCGELSALGYEIVVDPMFTGEWGDLKDDFFRLIGAPIASAGSNRSRRALFIDPDTGVHSKGSSRHVAMSRLVAEATNNSLVFSFDQSFSRQSKPREAMAAKLSALGGCGCHAMYYDSHARFLFVAQQSDPLEELRGHLVSLGLPPARLIHGGT